MYANPADTLNYFHEDYYENGKLFAKGKYSNGKQDGLWEWWYDNGNKRDEAMLKHGEYIGQRKHWFENGKIKQLEIINGECFGDCCNGEVIKYYDNGQVQSEGRMLNGDYDGKYVYHYDNGQAKKEEYFNVGLRNGNYLEWFSNGKKWVVGFYKADKQDSIWTWYDTTGHVKSIQLFKDGQLIKHIK